MKDNVAVKINHISKFFQVPHEKHNSLKDKAVNIFSPRNYTKFKALEDIDFEIKKGEFFGIVGKNGSGKSTLLKIIANIYQPNSGSIEVNGSLAPFIELGVGFNMELTGRENVFLSGAILGMNRNKIQKIYNDIVNFAELEEFMDQKLKNYSSGMQVRLAFSIAVRAESDILLIDEVLAVGDAAFQQKCLMYFEKLKLDKKTVIFVSHDMDAVRQFCDKAILIKDSELVIEGTSQLVANRYITENYPHDSEGSIKLDSKYVKNIVLLNSKGRVSSSFDSNECISIVVDWKNNESIKNIGIAIYRSDGIYCFGTNTLVDNFVIKKNKAILTLKDIPLARGTYTVKLNLFGLTDQFPVEFVEEAANFVIRNLSSRQGVLNIQARWE